MSWIGVWRNQYGSTVEITSERDGRIEGVFRTVLEDSPFFGRPQIVAGTCSDDVIGFSFSSEGTVGAAACSFAGILRKGKLEALWHVVSSAALTAGREGEPARLKSLDAVHAFHTGLDHFERVG